MLKATLTRSLKQTSTRSSRSILLGDKILATSKALPFFSIRSRQDLQSWTNIGCTISSDTYCLSVQDTGEATDDLDAASLGSCRAARNATTRVVHSEEVVLHCSQFMRAQHCCSCGSDGSNCSRDSNPSKICAIGDSSCHGLLWVMSISGG